MKKIFAIIIIALAVVSGCKKYESKSLPVANTYVLKGNHANFYVNGVLEATNVNSLVLKSEKLSYDLIPGTDSLFKALWTGDKLSITNSSSYTYIYYYDSNGQMHIAVDSSNNNSATYTIQ